MNYIRKSSRLIAKQASIDTKKYYNLVKIINDVCNPILKEENNTPSWVIKVTMTDLITLLDENFSLLVNKKSKQMIHFLDTMYNFSLIHIITTSEFIKVITRLGKEKIFKCPVVNFCKQYKTHICANLENICYKYRLDMNVMLIIYSFV